MINSHHKKKKSLGGLFSYSERSSSSPNLKSFLGDEVNSNDHHHIGDSASSSIEDNQKASSSPQSLPSSPISHAVLALNSSSGSINNESSLSTSQHQTPTSNNSNNNNNLSPSNGSPIASSPILSKKKPSRLVQAFKRSKNNSNNSNKLRKEIEELTNKTGLNQQYTTNNLPFNVIDGNTIDLTDSVNNNNNHHHQISHSRTSSKKHQRKSRFIEPVSQSTEDYTDIPRLIKLSVEYLFEKCLKVPGLFRESANALELQRLNQVFEKGEDIDLSEYPDPHCIGGLLKLYFRERPTPIFPYELHKKIYLVLNEEESNGKIKIILESGLSKGQFLILRYLFELLNAVSNNCEINFMNYQNLAICFAPSLIQSYDPSCYDVIERLIDQYELIFSVVVVVPAVVEDNPSTLLKQQQSLENNGSLNKITVTILEHGDENDNHYNNHGHPKRSPKPSPKASPKLSPKLNSSNGLNRKSINLSSSGSNIINTSNGGSKLLVENELQSIDQENNTTQTYSRPRKNSTAAYLSRINNRRPSSWNNTNKKHHQHQQQQHQQNQPDTPNKRLNSVNGLDSFEKDKDVKGIYNSLKEESKNTPPPKKSSLNRQMTIVNNNSSGSNDVNENEKNFSDCTTSDEDEELKITKPISRSPSINNFSASNDILESIPSITTNTPTNSNVSISTPVTTKPTTTTYSPSSSTAITAPTTDKPVAINYNRFQPVNRTLSTPNVKNFSIPTNNGGVSNTRLIGKKTTPSLFSPRKQSIISKNKPSGGYVGSSSSTSLVSKPSPISTPSPTPTSSFSNLSSLSNSNASLNSSVSSTTSSFSNNSSYSKQQEKALPTKTTFVTQTSSPSLVSSQTNSKPFSSVLSNTPTLITSEKYQTAKEPITTSASTFNKGHSHSNSVSHQTTTLSPTSSSSSSSYSTVSPYRQLNHTASTSSLISKFNQIDVSSGSSSSNNPNWKGGVVAKKQDPVKKSLAIFEQKK